MKVIKVVGSGLSTLPPFIRSTPTASPLSTAASVSANDNTRSRKMVGKHPLRIVA